MSRIAKFLCRLMTLLISLCVLKPVATVHADTGKTYYPNTGAYLLARCDFIAGMTKHAAQFRDTGGSMQQFLASIQKATLDGEEKVKEDKLAIAQGAAMAAYENPSLSPQRLRDAAMPACLQIELVQMAKHHGNEIGIMRFCGINSFEHEVLLEAIFQLLTTDDRGAFGHSCISRSRCWYRTNT